MVQPTDGQTDGRHDDANNDPTAKSWSNSYFSQIVFPKNFSALSIKCHLVNEVNQFHKSLLILTLLYHATKKNFLKFWWDQEMAELKQQCVASCQTWKAAGRPRSGPIFDRYRKHKREYRNGIRIRQRDEKLFYTNDLHDALLKKQGIVFWNCWRSKFNSNKHSVKHVDGVTDPDDRMTRRWDMAVWSFPRWPPAAILNLIQPELAPLDPPSPKTPP